MAYSIILVLPVALLLIVLFAYLLKRLLKNKNPMELIVFGLELTVVGLFLH
jgi:flagellar biogenesis protein FliO